jgi:hypothetical protein
MGVEHSGIQEENGGPLIVFRDRQHPARSMGVRPRPGVDESSVSLSRRLRIAESRFGYASSGVAVMARSGASLIRREGASARAASMGGARPRTDLADPGLAPCEQRARLGGCRRGDRCNRAA